MTLSGKAALVAGGAGGIGAAICRRLSEQGATVCCADIAEERGQQLVESLRKPGHHADFERLDAGSFDSWKAVVDSMASRHGGIDLLVTSLYSGSEGSVTSTSPAEWEEAFRVTSTGVYLGMYAVRDVIRPGGSIVNIASIAAHGRAAGNAAYGAAKAGVISMSRSAAATFAPRGVRVNVVTPGLIDTPALDRTMSHFAGPEGDPRRVLAGFLQRVPLGRVGTPDDIAGTVAFLAGPDGGYITGSEVVVDGGFLLT